MQNNFAVNTTTMFGVRQLYTATKNTHTNTLNKRKQDNASE